MSECPDYVTIGCHLNEVRCGMCGRSYRWNMPVPVAVFVAGNMAFGREHGFCVEWRDEWRERLLATLSLRGLEGGRR